MVGYYYFRTGIIDEMNIQKAAERTIAHVSDFCVERDPEGRTTEHACWMLNGIIEGYIQNEKAHRWLAYAQAIIVLKNEATLNEMKAANKGEL